MNVRGTRSSLEIQCWFRQFKLASEKSRGSWCPGRSCGTAPRYNLVAEASVAHPGPVGTDAQKAPVGAGIRWSSMPMSTRSMGAAGPEEYGELAPWARRAASLRRLSALHGREVMHSGGIQLQKAGVGPASGPAWRLQKAGAGPTSGPTWRRAHLPTLIEQSGLSLAGSMEAVWWC
jgi:hypothetical protein